jgi:hypothetical protein
MSSRTTTLVGAGWALVLFSAQATPQARLKGRVQTPENNPLVAREQVTIDGAGKYTTDDGGEFEFDLVQGLKVGQPARFRVIHVNPIIKIQQWIVVRPCDLLNGRKDSLPDVGLEPIPIVVLPRGDRRLISLKNDYSILGCIIEEMAAEFQKASGHDSHVPLSARFPMVVKVTYSVSARDKASASSLESVRDSTPLDQSSLARRAVELGFTPQELGEALSAWARSVEDTYQKGLAALYQGRYAEASGYISASIPSPPGEFLKSSGHRFAVVV